MWLKLVATGVTILSHFQEEVDQRVSGALSTGTRANYHSQLSDWLPTWRCMMQQREAAAYGGVGGGRKHTETASICLLTHAEPQSLGVSARSHLQIDLSPFVLVSLCGGLREEG